MRLGRRGDHATVANAYNGQVAGINIHTFRLELALLHEVLQVISDDDERGVFDQPEFLKVLEVVPSEALTRWKQLVATSQRDGKPDEFVQWLADVRNKATFHYGDRKALLRSYNTFFGNQSKTVFNKQAAVSKGRTTAGSRFYFADAAVAKFIDVPGASYEKRAMEHFTSLAVVLKAFVDAYIQIRATGPTPTA